MLHTVVGPNCVTSIWVNVVQYCDYIRCRHFTILSIFLAVGLS